MSETLFNSLFSPLLKSCTFKDCFGFFFDIFFTTITTPILLMLQRTQGQHDRKAVYSHIFPLLKSSMFVSFSKNFSTISTNSGRPESFREKSSLQMMNNNLKRAYASRRIENHNQESKGPSKVVCYVQPFLFKE